MALFVLKTADLLARYPCSFLYIYHVHRTQPTGDGAMKKVITVKANAESYDILLNDVMLDALDDEKCDCLIRRLEAHVTAYQNLRRAKTGIERAEMEMAAVKANARPIDDDIPF